MKHTHAQTCHVSETTQTLKLNLPDLKTLLWLEGRMCEVCAPAFCGFSRRCWALRRRLECALSSLWAACGLPATLPNTPAAMHSSFPPPSAGMCPEAA